MNKKAGGQYSAYWGQMGGLRRPGIALADTLGELIVKLINYGTFVSFTK